MSDPAQVTQSTITAFGDYPSGAWDGCYIEMWSARGRQIGIVQSTTRDMAGGMTTLTYRPATRWERLRYSVGKWTDRWVRRPLRWLRRQAWAAWDVLTGSEPGRDSRAV
jgi:hypothetical protein